MTPEEAERMAMYGYCPLCHAPRDILVTASAEGQHMKLICPNGHNQDRGSSDEGEWYLGLAPLG